MDRRHIELQIRTILVTYRGERRHHHSEVMHGVRQRAEELLADLEGAVEAYPDLRARLAEVRREINEAGG